ncbi:hypothetical protein QBC46DRAFT_264813 [Diplogelasinospora grovesii]|uniref:Uncharacterized protein n=1 Tax=Diplogelasinospora grovesii TaxID=303347 RepID=A0AAN6N3U1_9PEZI|nr:hypothetical protein QBC46DRAFT_264813 [Diplogelasinospora grovesii]
MPSIPYHWNEIFPLLVGAVMVLEGLWGIFHPESGMLSFGLPPHMATNRSVRSVFTMCSVRTLALGALILNFCYEKKYEAVDFVMFIVGFWLGFADGFICWEEGDRDTAVLRGVMGALMLFGEAWGLRRPLGQVRILSGPGWLREDYKRWRGLSFGWKELFGTY